jgi:hypothetical protein
MATDLDTTPPRARKNNIAKFRTACTDGNLNDVKHFVERFGLSAANARADDNFALDGRGTVFSRGELKTTSTIEVARARQNGNQAICTSLCD